MKWQIIKKAFLCGGKKGVWFIRKLFICNFTSDCLVEYYL